MSSLKLSVAAPVAAAAALVGVSASAQAVVTPFVNGDFELGDPAADDPGPGFVVATPSGFFGVNGEADSDLFNGNFAFLGGGASISADTTNRLPVVAGVEYTLQADVLGFGGGADDGFAVISFFDATGAEVNRLEGGFNVDDGVVIADFALQTGTAGVGAVSVGFDLFGGGGLSVDNFEVSAIPEPSSLALAAASMGLLTLRRRKRS